MKQSEQKAFMQFIVYNGSQQIIKKRTMMERFCVALTSRFRAAPNTLSMVPLCGFVVDSAMRDIDAFDLLLLFPEAFIVTVCFTCKLSVGLINWAGILVVDPTKFKRSNQPVWWWRCRYAHRMPKAAMLEWWLLQSTETEDNYNPLFRQSSNVDCLDCCHCAIRTMAGIQRYCRVPNRSWLSLKE